MVRKITDIFETIEDQVKKINTWLTDRINRIIYLLETNTDHEFLTLVATTKERKVMFEKGPCRDVTVMTDADVWIDFDRKAGVNSSHSMLAGESLNVSLWVTELHAITEAATANLRIIGLR